MKLDRNELEEKKVLYDEYENLLFFSDNKPKEKIWVRKSFLLLYLIIGLLMIFNRQYVVNLELLGFALFSIGLFGLGQKNGHRSGYFDGYEAGLEDRVDKVSKYIK